MTGASADEHHDEQQAGPEPVGALVARGRQPGMTGRRRHPVRWVAGAVLLVLVVVGVALATRTPQEATAVASPLLGHPAPAFTGTDLTTGAPVSLASLRGHYVVVNFFASWCIPCQEEAPDLSRFHYAQAHDGRAAPTWSASCSTTRRHGAGFLRDNGDLWPAVGRPRRRHR